MERGGKVRSQHVPDVSAKTLRPILTSKSTRPHPDDGWRWQYRRHAQDFARHGTVNHGIEEYVRGAAHTNTIEGYFSILKRGIIGTYHHVSAAAFEALSCGIRFPLQRARGAWA